MQSGADANVPSVDVPREPDDPAEPRHESRRRLVWSAIFTAHATGAVLWWWLTPKGFALARPQFWTNQVLPWIVLAAMLLGRWALGAAKSHAFVTIVAALIMAWLAGVIAASDVYPVSFGFRGLVLLIVPLAMYAALVRGAETTLSARRRPRLATTGGIVCGALLGAWFAISQQAPLPNTRPLNDPSPAAVVPADAAADATADVTPDTTAAPDLRSIRLGDIAQVQPGEALVNVFAGRRMLGVQPVLTFVSRSPDRCWTLFAPRALRNGPPRRLLSCTRPSDDVVRLALRDDCDSAMRVTRSPPSVVEVESLTTLPRPIYSHLNTFTELTLTGHRRLSIEFSPCAVTRIEFEPMDYPRGRPARFAYLDAAGIFHVAQASSAEKGPFHDFAAGALRRDQSLSMTFFDQGVAVFRVTFDDWAAQLSTAPSPTAGWGVPVNAIEFSLQGDQPTSAAGIFVTLAATSVGRGFDSVGHAAGTYRNRIRIERLAE